MEECTLCKGTGWILHEVFQDTVHADMNVFVHKLYVECKCKQAKVA